MDGIEEDGKDGPDGKSLGVVFETATPFETPGWMKDLVNWFNRAVEEESHHPLEAGYLLTIAFPALTLEQADKILTETEGQGGGFLDNGSPFGVYSRLNLVAAAHRAAQITAGKQ